VPGFGRRRSAAGRGRWLEEKGRRPGVAAGVVVPSAAAAGAESSGGRRSCPYYCRELSARKERTEKQILTNEGKMVSILVFYGEHIPRQNTGILSCPTRRTSTFFFQSEKRKKRKGEACNSVGRARQG